MRGRYHFHTIIRTIGKREIFTRFEDKALFLGILRRFAIKYNIQILEFTILDWQVFLLYCGDSLSGSKNFTGELQQNFSYWWNRFNGNGDKLFVGASCRCILDGKDLVKCGVSILYAGTAQKSLCSYWFHYDFMRKFGLTRLEKKSLWKIKVMFDTINRSRSSRKNRCPALEIAVSNGEFSLGDIISVDTFYLDRHFTCKEFCIVIQKCGLLLPELKL